MSKEQLSDCRRIGQRSSNNAPGGVVVTITGDCSSSTTTQINLGLFQSRSQEDTIQFRHGDTEAQTGTDRFVSHIRNVEFVQVDAAVVQVNVAADAFRRDVRFTQTHGVSAHTLGRIDFNTEGLARTEHIVLRKASRQNHAVGRGVAGTKLKWSPSDVPLH